MSVVSAFVLTQKYVILRSDLLRKITLTVLTVNYTVFIYFLTTEIPVLETFLLITILK